MPTQSHLEPQQSAKSDFSQRLAKLNGAALALTYATSIEAFWRAAIELGVQQLGFAQLTLWRTDIVPNRLYGTFRIDAAGNLRDERSFSFAITEDLTLQHYIQQSTQREPGWLNHASIAATVQPLLTGLPPMSPSRTAWSTASPPPPARANGRWQRPSGWVMIRCR